MVESTKKFKHSLSVELVDEPEESKKSYMDVLFDEWINKLQKEKVFESSDPDSWTVTFENYIDVINVFKTRHRLGPAIKEAEAYLLS